jgi:acetyl esterase/lipase
MDLPPTPPTHVSPLHVLTAGLLVLAGVTAYRHYEKVRRVPRELRTPLLYMPFPAQNRVNLAFSRRLITRFAEPPSLPEGLLRNERIAPGQSGAPDVPAITFERSDRPRRSPALLWIHGGGFVGGSATIGSTTAVLIAKELNILVASVDYRLAPETPFPGALDDCYAALKWLHESAPELGIDPNRIAIAGSSAGGGLAAALAQRALDAGDVRIAFQMLLYPMLDDRTALKKDHAGRGELMWTNESNLFAWESYLGHALEGGEHRPYAVPARRENLTGLPPAWIGVGSLDLFCEEDLKYAERLRAASVPCDVDIVEGAYHGFDEQAPKAPEAAAFFGRAMDTLKCRLGLAVHG